jgi:regulator of protease activity HflC (stomatin/prohibitin superfamily)
MGTIFFLVVSVLAGIVGLLMFKFSEDENLKFGGLFTAGIGLLFFISVWLIGAIYIIDDGEMALLRKFGKVYDTEIESGVHFKRPWADRITWATRLTSIKVDDMEVRTRDEVVVAVDFVFYYAIMPEKLIQMYKEVAKESDILLQNFIIPEINTAIKDEVANVAYKELNGKRNTIATAITVYTKKILEMKYVKLNNIKVGQITPPKEIDDAIKLKEAMKQKAEKAMLEVVLTKNKAQIRREEAKGIADAQKIIQKRLTPLYVQWYAIDKISALAESKNTTFYMIPMSGKTGIPAILGPGSIK